MTLNSKNMISLVVALIVLGVGVYSYQNHQEQKEDAGRSALYQAQKTYEEELKTIPEAERNQPLDIATKFPKTVAAYQHAQTVGTDQTKFESAYQLAQVYLLHQSYDGALQALQGAQEHASGNFEKTSVLFLKGRIYEVTQKYSEASQTFNQALSKGFEGLKAEIFSGLVRSYFKEGQKEKAKTYLEKFKKDFPKAQDLEPLEKMLGAE